MAAKGEPATWDPGDRIENNFDAERATLVRRGERYPGWHTAEMGWLSDYMLGRWSRVATA